VHYVCAVEGAGAVFCEEGGDGAAGGGYVDGGEEAFCVSGWKGERLVRVVMKDILGAMCFGSVGFWVGHVGLSQRKDSSLVCRVVLALGHLLPSIKSLCSIAAMLPLFR
jgi:hypothetical protein